MKPLTACPMSQRSFASPPVRAFLLDEKAYKRFTAALDKPPADNPKLRRLLASKAPWER